MVELLSLDAIVLQQEPRRYLYRGKEYRSITDHIQSAGLGPDFSAVPEERLARACTRGEYVHKACHYYAEGDLNIDTVDPGIRGYVEAYIRFCEECPGKIVALEKKLVSPDLQLGCTPDVIRFMKGRRSAVELKTSQNGGGHAARLQTAGQATIWNVIHPKERVSDRYGLTLRPNGTYRLDPHADASDFSAFHAVVAYSRALENLQSWMPKYGKALRT